MNNLCTCIRSYNYKCYTILSGNSLDPVKKPVRPLSANRRTPNTDWADPDTEASAVMAALRAENEQASKCKNVSI